MIVDTLKALWTKPLFRYAVVFIGGCLVTTIVYPSVSKEKTVEESIRTEVTQEYEKKLSEKEKEKSDLQAHYETQISQIQTQSSQKESELTQKITSLTTEVSSLSKQTFTETVEIHKPDGTVEKHRVTTSLLQTMNEKVAQVQQETEQKYKEQLDKTVKTYESKITDISSSYEKQLSETSEELSKSKQTVNSERKEHDIEMTNNRKLGVSAGYNTDRTYKVHGHYYLWGSVFGGVDVDSNLKDIYRGALSLGLSF